MSAMAAAAETGVARPPTVIEGWGPWTLEQVYAGAFPDDGRRFELCDGVLIVSPAARPDHQIVVAQLVLLLAAAAPRDLLVFPGSNVDQEPATNLQPDVEVLARSQRRLPSTQQRPLLVVEVASRSSRRIDRTLKRAVYEEMGIPSYWLVDMLGPQPVLAVLELRPDGRYAEVAVVRGEEAFAAQRPFPVRVVPQALLDDGYDEADARRS